MATAAKTATKKVAKKKVSTKVVDTATAVPAAPTETDLIVDGKVWGTLELPATFAKFTPVTYSVVKVNSNNPDNQPVPHKFNETNVMAVPATPYGKALKELGSSTSINIEWLPEKVEQFKKDLEKVRCKDLYKLLELPKYKFLLQNKVVVTNLEKHVMHGQKSTTSDEKMLCDMRGIPNINRGKNFKSMENTIGLMFPILTKDDPNNILLVSPFISFSNNMQTRITDRLEFIRYTLLSIYNQAGKTKKDVTEMRNKLNLVGITAVKIPTYVYMSLQIKQTASISQAAWSAEEGNALLTVKKSTMGDTSAAAQIDSADQLWSVVLTMLTELFFSTDHVKYPIFVNSHFINNAANFTSFTNISKKLTDLATDLYPEKGILHFNSPDMFKASQQKISESLINYLV